MVLPRPVTNINWLTPVGSGPYVVSSINIGKTVTYKRNVNYWAKDLGCTKRDV